MTYYFVNILLTTTVTSVNIQTNNVTIITIKKYNQFARLAPEVLSKHKRVALNRNQVKSVSCF